MNATIAHITSVHRVNDVRIYQKEARSLYEAGYPVVIIGPESGVRLDGVQLRSFKPAPSRILRVWHSSRLIWKQVRMHKNIRLVHFHDPELCILGLFFKTARYKVVFDVHEKTYEQILQKHWIPRILRWPVAGAARLFERFAAQFFDGIVTATPAIAAGFSERKTTLVQNYPVPDMFDLPPSEKRANPYFGAIYAGKLSELRGAVTMVQAASLLPSTNAPKLTLIGDFASDGSKEKVESMAGWQHVDYSKALPYSEARTRMQQAQAGIVAFHPAPNHIEAQPTKLFEYMAAGCAVVASDFPYWKSIIERFECGLCIDPTNPEALAKALVYLKNNPEITRQMGENGRFAVREIFNWSAESEKLIHLYNTLLGTPVTKAPTT